MSSARHQLDPRTLEILVCPLTKTRLSLSDSGDELLSAVARVAFPIRDGVPLLCIEEVRDLSDEEVARISR
ncbi:MAG TPA: Trm112 family protein [Devosiaceae bacterium]